MTLRSSDARTDIVGLLQVLGGRPVDGGGFTEAIPVQAMPMVFFQYLRVSFGPGTLGTRPGVMSLLPTTDILRSQKAIFTLESAKSALHALDRDSAEDTCAFTCKCERCSGWNVGSGIDDCLCEEGNATRGQCETVTCIIFPPKRAGEYFTLTSMLMNFPLIRSSDEYLTTLMPEMQQNQRHGHRGQNTRSVTHGTKIHG